MRIFLYWEFSENIRDKAKSAAATTGEKNRKQYIVLTNRVSLALFSKIVAWKGMPIMNARILVKTLQLRTQKCCPFSLLPEGSDA